MEAGLLPPSLLLAVRVSASRCAPSSTDIICGVQSAIGVVNPNLSDLLLNARFRRLRPSRPMAGRCHEDSCGGSQVSGASIETHAIAGRHSRNQRQPPVSQGIHCSWPLDLYDWIDFPATEGAGPASTE